MIAQLARFANDCYHIWRSPTGSRATLLRDLILPGDTKMGFRVAHFDQGTLNYLYREIFARQNYYFRSVNDAPVILDCGANIGMATLYFKWLYPNAVVKSFEPDPTTFQLLKQNISANKLNVEAYNCALWDKDGDLEFFVDSSHPGALLMSTDASRLKSPPIKVAAHRLSDFIQDTVDFVKLDIEGAEHKVLCELLQSGKARAIRQMVIEYHHRIGQQKSRLGEFLAMLEHAGFEYQIHGALYPVSSRHTFQDLLIGAYQS
jgi:FkbM family methyltransferase